jgi:alkylation response protein AidB-like acyl-CoA dehydrogenase
LPTLVADTVGAREWADRATAHGPIIQRYRDESERQRKMARPIFEAIVDTGILEMLVPRAFGGLQAEPTAQLRVIEEISRYDASAGWNVMIWSGAGLFADYLSEQAAQEILGPGQGTVLGGAVNPTGQATPVPGGFRVAGRWSFASGCHYLTWFLAGCMLMDGDRPRMLDNGAPDLRAVLIPARYCEILDTWHSAGLRGTGSHDFRVDNAFVPTEHTMPLFKFFAGPTVRPGTAYPSPFYDLASPSLAAVGLGIARDAIESFKSLARCKTPAIGTTMLANQHTIHQRVGKAEALLRSARVYLYSTLEEINAAHQGGAPIREEDSAALRLATSHCAQSAVEVVDLMFDAAGGTSVYESSRLERCFRDVHVVTHHMMAAPANVEMVGHYLLGGPLQVRR